MKTFTFLNQEYQDLNSLGLAFSSNFKKAVEAIQNKNFLSFIKKFKKQKKNFIDIFYETKYVQSVLSILIYHMTEEHLLVLGGKKYDGLESVLKDIHHNGNILLFLEDKGFRHTIMDSDEVDEKLKNNLLASEDYYSDSFVIRFLETYYEYDSIETMDGLFNDLFSGSADAFKRAQELFLDENVDLFLAHHYSLKEVLEFRKDACPVFKGFKLIQSEYPREQLLPILENSFYMFVIEHLKSYTYRKAAKKFNKKFMNCKKEWLKKLKKKKTDSNEVFQMHYELYQLYLKMVDYSQKKYILAKAKCPEYALEIPYANTFICQAYMEEKDITGEEQETEYVPSDQPEYDLAKLSKSIAQHQHFASCIITLTLILAVVLAAGIVIAKVKPELLKSMDHLEESLNNLISIKGSLIPLIAGVGVTFIMSIFILIKKCQARKRYNQLGKLNYYRHNESILTSKDRRNFEKLAAREKKNAKVIDRFYRFYGAIDMAGFCLFVVLFGIVLMVIAGGALGKDIVTNASGILAGTCEKGFFIYLPSVLVLLLGLLRHKKTGWSAFLTFLLGLACSVGVCFLVGLM